MKTSKENQKMILQQYTTSYPNELNRPSLSKSTQVGVFTVLISSESQANEKIYNKKSHVPLFQLVIQKYAFGSEYQITSILVPENERKTNKVSCQKQPPIGKALLRLEMSCHMGKPTICIGENIGADQLRSNCGADQRLCFRYTDSTIPPLSKSKMSCF